MQSILAIISREESVLKMVVGGEPSLPLVIGWSLLVIAMGFLPLVSVVGYIGIWGERKVSAWLQHRRGPNRVGPIGLLQSLADGIKLVTKEDLLPNGADRFLFTLAPYLAFAPVFAAFMAIPFGPNLIFEPALSVGLFWMLAILSVEVIGIILAGWSSNNKWSIYGAMREACQLISYEIPLGLSIIVVVVAAGTLDMLRLTEMQLGGAQHWLIFRQPFLMLAFVVFFVASLASNKRAPFDLPESESELVAGYHTEYSGLRFSLFYLAEYNAMFVMSAVMSVLFLGGWDDAFGIISHQYAQAAESRNLLQLLLINSAAFTVFLTKIALLIFVQMWVRWTLPRPRIDQVLHACIKVLLPFSCVLLLGSTIWELLVTRDSTIFIGTRWTLLVIGTGFTGFILLILASGIIGGRRNRQRLSEAPLRIA